SDAFGTLIERVFGCHADVELHPGVRALKKSNPSGGGLHPLEAYVLARRVDGVATGLYHYHAGTHALEPIAALSEAEASEHAHRFVAGQQYLADAPVLIALVARFARSFWKYRRHPKAYRAIVLEAGHVAQNLYLAATELGLGAFVTAAINEVAIERAFGLDALDESPLAVCGFGTRADVRATIEFDPLQRIWRGDVRAPTEPERGYTRVCACARARSAGVSMSLARSGAVIAMTSSARARSSARAPTLPRSAAISPNHARGSSAGTPSTPA
ncbi:MAG TPA: putative peptide maturation dehydrogenase, partial [Rhodanobacteraceae bacterium]|nr:putative peptide maturation dehydrogenase [Rhodanobacteraceae bacterium]